MSDQLPPWQLDLVERIELEMLDMHSNTTKYQRQFISRLWDYVHDCWSLKHVRFAARGAKGEIFEDQADANRFCETVMERIDEIRSMKKKKFDAVRAHQQKLIEVEKAGEELAEGIRKLRESYTIPEEEKARRKEERQKELDKLIEDSDKRAEKLVETYPALAAYHAYVERKEEEE